MRVFAEHGDRTDRKKARLKYLVDRWGVPKFLEETEKKLAFPVLHLDASEHEPRGPIDRAGHLGVHVQVQPGLHYLGVVVPVGWLPVEQARAVAGIADRFGNGELRLTVWQNLLIPNVAAEHLSAACAALREAGLNYTAGRVLSGDRGMHGRTWLPLRRDRHQGPRARARPLARCGSSRLPSRSTSMSPAAPIRARSTTSAISA